MISGEYISPKEILSDVLMLVNDEEYSNGITSGFYYSQIQSGLDSLSIESDFNRITKDEDFDSIKLQMNKPEGCYDIREMYLYNGSCCQPNGNIQNVMYKRNYNNGKGGEFYTSRRRMGMGTDAFFKPFYNMIDMDLSNVYWANEQNGLLMFSPNCKGFSYIRFVFHGFPVAIGDVPIVPRECKQALIDWVKVKVLEVLKARDIKYRTMWADAKLDLEGAGRIKKGSWDKAKDFLKRMPTWKKESYREYLGKMNF